MMLQAFVAPVSTSLEVNVPVAVAIPDATVPSTRLPASVIDPAAAESELVTTGASLVP